MPVCPSGHTSASADYCDVCGDLMDGAPRAEFPAETPSSPPSPPSRARPSPSPPPSPQASPAEAVCPRCGSPRSGRFCEVDGHDFEAGGAHTVAMSAVPASRIQAAGQAAGQAVGGATSGPGTDVPAPRVGAASEPPGSEPSRPDIGRPDTGRSDTGWSVLICADRDYYNSVIALEGPDSTALTFPPYCPDRRVALSGDEVRIGRRSTSRALLPEIDLSTPPEDPGVSHMHAVLLRQPDGTWALVDPGSTNGTTVNGGTEPIAVNVPVPMGDGDRIHVGAWTTLTLSLGESPP
ncbi:FHA domain-containing protein [Actinomadura macra]|uniref:FHA domain-containing protein n=1 Tax=Actinomadura macra TaxID=46164 RepID=UPI00082AEADF|nr:FHA domain-containing protein [Actinomadura macra]